jgi:hypothetical protein
MTSFNLSKFLSARAKKEDLSVTDEQLDKSRGGEKKTPTSITEDQLSDGYRGKEGDTITEERLEKVRTGGGESLVEGMLNTSKSKLHKHRNEEASAGDINKVEEQRLANKKRQETEKQEPSSETGKKNRLLDNNTSKSDGLKLAGPEWGFTKEARMVPRTSPEAMFWCRQCGTTYDEKPAMDQSGAMCEKCGGIKIERIPGKYYTKPRDGELSPAHLDPTKPMPKLQSGIGRIVTAQWAFDNGTPEAAGQAVARDIMDIGSDVEAGDAIDDMSDFQPENVLSADDIDADEDVKFEEDVAGRTSAGGTRMEIIEIRCRDIDSYKNEAGQLDNEGETRMISDIMAFMATEHPEMRQDISSKMLNTTKIRDGKVFYLRPL